MSSSRPPYGDHDHGIHVPSISRALLDELATHLRDCCQEPIDVPDLNAQALTIGVQPRPGDGRGVPTPVELDNALTTIARAAALMAEFQSLMKPAKEYEEVKRGLHVLSDRLSQYEHGFEILNGQLRDMQDIAEVYRRRCMTAEHKLAVLKDAVSGLLGVMLAGGLTTFDLEAATQ